MVDTFWQNYVGNPQRATIQSFHTPLNLLRLPSITIIQITRVDVNRSYELIDKLYEFIF